MNGKATRVRRGFRVALCLALAGWSVAAAGAQPPPGRPLDQMGDELAPGELQRLFDAYAILQAQETLGLNDAQFGQFLPRLRAVQQARRQGQVGRNRMLNQLNRLTSPRAAEALDEAKVRDLLKALADHDLQAAANLAKAYEGIDQVLDVRQRARFRVFEEQMERRKFDLMMRARLRERTNRQPPPPGVRREPR